MSHFACVLDCMDGRTKHAVTRHIRKNYHVKWCDLITKPGINKVLADNADRVTIEDIKKMMDISIHHHGSNVVFIVGHAECAGNPVGKEEQIRHLNAAKKTVDSLGFDIDIILLWVENDWKTVEEIDFALSRA